MGGRSNVNTDVQHAAAVYDPRHRRTDTEKLVKSEGETATRSLNSASVSVNRKR